MRGRVGGEDSSAGRISRRISRICGLFGVLGAHFFGGARLWSGARLGRRFLSGAHFSRGGLERRVAATKAAVLARNSEVNFDVLAKSLALNPYQPRFGVAEVAFYEHGGHRIVEAEVVRGLGEGGESGESKNAAAAVRILGLGGGKNYAESFGETSEKSPKKSHKKERPNDIFAALENAAQHPKKAIIADTTMQPNIALVGNLRRYSECLIIHRDIFISRYQILESAVFGADAVVLNAAVLTEDSLESLAFFAQKLGLLCVFEGEDSRGADSGVADSQIDSHKDFQEDSRGVIFLRDLGALERLRGEKIVVLGR